MEGPSGQTVHGRFQLMMAPQCRCPVPHQDPFLCSMPLPTHPSLIMWLSPYCGVAMSVSFPIKPQPGHKVGKEAPRSVG